MNKEVTFILKGCFLIAALFVTFRLLSYIINVRVSSDKKEIVIDHYIEEKSTTKYPDGKKIFTSNCASCHSLNKVIVGPALAGVTERIKDKKLLYQWIRNSPKVLKSGNKYFNDLYRQYNNVQMTSFSDLSDTDIDAIMAYISESNIKVYAPSAVAFN